MTYPDIFNIRNEEDFIKSCLETFRYQYENVGVYRRFTDFLKIDPRSVDAVEKIPFLPIEAFKSHKVLDKGSVAGAFFQSSGTTNIQTRSRHYIADFQLYERSISQAFKAFFGAPEEYVFLGLLPNYSENPHSSLIYMVDFLMKQSARPENGYFLYNHADLLNLLRSLNGRKVLLFGVSFALLDFLDFVKSQPEGLSAGRLTILETGGMKGRKAEMTKAELLHIFQEGFRTERVYSEYSMTELLSQAYSLGENIYRCPPWMRVLIRNTDDPLSYEEPGRTGAINIIDLANRHSCSFIATQDLGRARAGGFEVLGRIDHSDIRGCSLLVS